MEGWVKIHRAVLDWGWADIPEMFSFWMHLILSANHEDKEWHSMVIPRGSLVTTTEKLSIQTGLSISQVRTALTRLTKGGEIEVNSTNKFSIVTICKYADYQDDLRSESQTNDKQIANESQSNRNQIATNKKERREEKEDISSDISKKKKTDKTSPEPKKHYAERVLLTETEHSKLVAEYGEEDTRKMVEKLDKQKGSTGRTYKSDYLAILNWVVDWLKKEKEESKRATPQYRNEDNW